MMRWLYVLVTLFYTSQCKRTVYFQIPTTKTYDRPKEVDGAVIMSESRMHNAYFRNGVSSLVIKADDNGWMILFEKLKITDCNVTLKIAFSYSGTSLYKLQEKGDYAMTFTCDAVMPQHTRIFAENSKYMAVYLKVNDNSAHSSGGDYDFRFVATSFKPLRHGRCSSSRRQCRFGSSYIRSVCIDRDLTCDGIRNCENGEDEIKYCGHRSKSLLGNLISGIVTLFVICVLLSAIIAILKRFGCIRNNQRNGRTFGWQFGRRNDAGAPSSGVTMMHHPATQQPPAAVMYAPQTGVVLDNTQPAPQPHMFTGAGYGFSPNLTQANPAAPIYPPQMGVQPPLSGYPIQAAPGYTQPLGPPPSYSA